MSYVYREIIEIFIKFWISKKQEVSEIICKKECFTDKFACRKIFSKGAYE